MDGLGLFEADLFAAEAELNWAIADTALVGHRATPEEIIMLIRVILLWIEFACR